ncbi:hypothetical protein HZS_5591 [Henneguya salminicola]|nr:hypothetical protein HZS_5591 [Henneguya salminicola]
MYTINYTQRVLQILFLCQKRLQLNQLCNLDVCMPQIKKKLDTYIIDQVNKRFDILMGKDKKKHKKKMGKKNHRKEEKEEDEESGEEGSDEGSEEEGHGDDQYNYDQ